MRFFVGLDLGKERDFSALAVVEREMGAVAFGAPRMRTMRVRHLERLPLGTPYVRVVSRVAEVMRHPELGREARLVVDATGVGAPVVEMLRSAGLSCRVTAVTITSGGQANGRGEDWHVPKQDLMTHLRLLLEERQLKISRKLSETGALVKELLDIKLWQGFGGRMGMGAEGSGEHDDLAMAVALACWRGRMREIGFGTQRLPGI